MTVEERLNRLEKSWGVQDTIVRDLRDSMTVMAHLEKQQSAMLKDHAEWLHSHDKAMREHKQAMKDLDERIAKLVSGFGAYMRGEKPEDVK